MNVLAGVILGVKGGVPLVAFLTATGASCAYLLSELCGKAIIMHFFSDRLRKLDLKLKEQSGMQLFVYLVSLRIFPFSPNWFLNLASPILGIKLYMFYPSVLIGLLPFHYVTVKAGTILSELQSSRDIMQTNTILLFCFISILLVALSLFRKSNFCKKLLKFE